MTDANRPSEGQHRRSATTWLLIGFIVVLAIAVPVGLYLLSQMSVSGGGTERGVGATLSVATNPSPGATIDVPRPPRNTPNPGNRRTMDVLVIDQVTKQPIAGLIAEVTGRSGFSGRTGSDGHVRIPLPADNHFDFFNFRVRGKNYVPLRMYWSANEPPMNDGIFPPSYTMEMEHGTRIGGKIVDDAGKPVAGATLVFQFTKHFSNPHQLIAAIAGVNRAQPTVSDAQGDWSFPGPPANCEEIDITVRERRTANSDQGPPQPFTPVSKLYDGTATLTLHRDATGNGTVVAPVVQGTVTDAETGKPIDGFKITFGFTGNDDQRVRWGPVSSDAFGLQISPGGRFQFTNPGKAVVNMRGLPAKILLKIEAKGYSPVLTRPVQPGEADVELDVKMKRGEDLIATIVGTDGKPVAGAKSWLAVPGNGGLQIRDDKAEQPADNVQQTSGTDGRIDFGAQIGNFEVVVMADGGFAEANQDALAKSKQIALSPWGRVEGRMMVGTKPAAGADVVLRRDTDGPFGPDKPHVRLSATAKTDDTGQFTVEHLAPGHWVVGRRLVLDSSGPTDSMSQSFDATPGETVHLVAGGMGRPVIGSVNLPADLAARSDWVYGVCSIDPDEAAMVTPTPVPPAIQTAPFEQQEEWWIAWANSDAGKAFLEKQKKEMGDRYAKPFAIARDGSFRVDDITAGQYEVNIQLQVKWNGDLWNIAAGSAALTVPPIARGRSDEPLRMDPVSIVALGKYKVGDAVYDFPLKSTEGEKLKLSDFRGKYVLLEIAFEGPGSPDFGLTDAYRAYGQDGRLVMLSVRSRAWISPNQFPIRQPDIPWKQAMVSDDGSTADFVLQRNFTARWGGAWLIGPDGKVVANGLQGDGVSAAVKAALGAPATQASTAH